MHGPAYGDGYAQYALDDERIMAEGEETPRAVVLRVAQLELIHWGDELGLLLERTDVGPGILLNSARKAGSQNGLAGLGTQYDTLPRAASADRSSAEEWPQGA